ncbi:hypothetical protein GC174_10170 [bacterium]|nr:hypothetical protein [bacterium]
MPVDETYTNKIDFGPISSIELPSKWVEQPHHNKDIHSPRTLRKFHHPEDDRIQLCLFYRGLPVTAPTAESFANSLAGEPGSITEDILEALQEVLGPLALKDDFNVEDACLKALNGRKVIAIEGRWPGLDLKSVNIFIDAKGDGAIIYELYYAAPGDCFDQHKETAEAAFASIAWSE